jgi:hypothetical protein
MRIVAQYKEDTKQIFQISVWPEIPDSAKNFLDITDREGSTGNVSSLLGKYVINDQITDSVTQSAPVVEAEPVEETPAEEQSDE